MKSRGRSHNPQLPSHIIDLILSKLSIFILLNFRQVCKAWNNLILTGKLRNLNSKPNLFAHISPYHQKLHFIEFDSKILKEGKKTCIAGSFTFPPRLSTFKIINSCNGLFCFVNTEIICEYEKVRFGFTQPFAIILNPMTNEYVELPLNNALKFYTGYSFGFGYSPNKKQYKIVKLSSIRRGLYVADIFTIGTFTRGSYGKWSRIPALIRFYVFGSDGVYLNGSLYWNGYQHNYRDMRNGGKVVLLRFDVEDEKFQVVSFPQEGVKDEVFRRSSNIWIFNNTLYLSCCDLNIESSRFHVWKLMEEDYSWVKLEQEFVITQPIKGHSSTVVVRHHIRYCGPYGLNSRYQFQLVKAFEDEKLLFLVSRRTLILYDTKTQQIEAVYDKLNQNQHGNLWIYEIDSFNFDSLPKTLGVN